MALPSHAFDTGHHADMTRDAMHEAGFGDTAIQVAQVENWFVDYYSSNSLSSISTETARLHFDNLFTNAALQNYWGRLILHSKTAAQECAHNKDSLGLLSILGISLHTVQDFYSHSNWTETHLGIPGEFRTETWFGDSHPSLPTEGSAATYYTGAYPTLRPGATVLHGDYFGGLNKDSYVRPHWDQSYVFAFVATRQWIQAVKGWVDESDPTFWAKALAFAVDPAEQAKLDSDSKASYRLSEMVALPLTAQNGHWKGNGSGRGAQFLSLGVAWLSERPSRFREQFSKYHIYRALSDNLTGDPSPSSPPAIPVLPIHKRAVMLRTLRVEQQSNSFSPPAFAARVTVDGQTFVDAVQVDKRVLNWKNRTVSSPTPTPIIPWTILKFVDADPPAAISIRYELWGETMRGADEAYHINPVVAARDLFWDYTVSTHQCAGDVSGIYDPPKNPFSASGGVSAKRRAGVTISITDIPLHEPTADAFPASLPPIPLSHRPTAARIPTDSENSPDYWHADHVSLDFHPIGYTKVQPGFAIDSSTPVHSAGVRANSYNFYLEPSYSFGNGLQFFTALTSAQRLHSSGELLYYGAGIQKQFAPETRRSPAVTLGAYGYLGADPHSGETVYLVASKLLYGGLDEKPGSLYGHLGVKFEAFAGRASSNGIRPFVGVNLGVNRRFFISSEYSPKQSWEIADQYSLKGTLLLHRSLGVSFGIHSNGYHTLPFMSASF